MKQRKGLSTYTDSDGSVNFKLYDTVILKIKNNKLILNSGGWITNHTKNCINDNLPPEYKLYQKNYNWYVDTPTSKKIKFEDNIIISIVEKTA